MRRTRRNSVPHLIGVLFLALVAGACTGSDDGAGGSQERERITVTPNRSAPVYVANVTFTEDGFEPETLFLPAGHPVRLVLRNRTEHEHHYRVVGLVASELRWVEYPEVDLYDLDTYTAEELAAMDPDLADITDVAELEHVLHHLMPVFAPTKEASVSGIKPLGTEVHGYAERGGFDTLTFYPLTTGEFVVEDVLNPEITGKVIVVESQG